MVSLPRLLLGMVATSKGLVVGDFSYINMVNGKGPSDPATRQLVYKVYMV